MRILFIAWDGPYVNYIDGLFLPIFAGLRRYGHEFHILHFTWAEDHIVADVAAACQKKNIPYRCIKVRTWPHAVIGKYFSLLTAPRHVDKFVRDCNIDAVMPRTMMPARITLKAVRHRSNLKLIFDADGLPIEERVDFAGLKKNSFRYRQLKKIEKAIVAKADVILCRSDKAIQFLTEQYGRGMKAKFYRVINGRDETVFQRIAENESLKIKRSLGIPRDGFVAVYTGSLGPQYGVEQMLDLHAMLLSGNPKTYLLMLTGNPDYLARYGPDRMRNVLVRKVPGGEVPKYLSTADVAFALRKATLSMRGVSPIKLGEYLLMGLPVVASGGIGDTEEILRDKPFSFILSGLSKPGLDQAVEWITGLECPSPFRQDARSCGEAFFGLTKAVESYRLALQKLAGL